MEEKGKSELKRKSPEPKTARSTSKAEKVKPEKVKPEKIKVEKAKPEPKKQT